MLAEMDTQEYLDEIRREVCSLCVERPEGGPPCGPLGKPCGVELHLPALVGAVRQVHSDLMAPYLEHNRKEVCETCPFLHSSHCPCPMDTLAVLVVQAIEAVDARHERQEKVRIYVQGEPAPGIDEIMRAFEAAAGKWTGCDWPTAFGPDELNLEGWTAAAADTRAVEAAGPGERQVWQDAAVWLEEVERRAVESEEHAALAVETAAAGDWRQALNHALRAWALEFATGRPFRRQPANWQALYELIEAAARVHGVLELEAETIVS
jgi:hypothetical protein